MYAPNVHKCGERFIRAEQNGNVHLFTLENGAMGSSSETFPFDKFCFCLLFENMSRQNAILFEEQEKALE